MNVNHVSYEEVLQWLSERKPFTTVRYGDGEWNALLGLEGQNCDGVEYTKELQKLLLHTLIFKREYYYCITSEAISLLGEEIDALLNKYLICIDWYDLCDSLTRANKQGELGPLLEILRERKVGYIGPGHLRDINNKLFPYEFLVEVPNTLAHLETSDIVANTLKLVDYVDIIGVSAGPGAKIIIHKLHEYIGHSHTIIDFGSIFDGYVGRYSRKYHREADWNKIMENNLRRLA